MPARRGHSVVVRLGCTSKRSRGVTWFHYVGRRVAETTLPRDRFRLHRAEPFEVPMAEAPPHRPYTATQQRHQHCRTADDIFKRAHCQAQGRDLSFGYHRQSPASVGEGRSSRHARQPIGLAREAHAATPLFKPIQLTNRGPFQNHHG